jgi:ubiquinone/menaquinone biosynthesis C-methylase UbiE
MEKPVTNLQSEDHLKQEINQIWNEGAEGYDKQYAHGLHTSEEKQAWLEALDKIVGPGPLSIADVGSGTGFLALLLAELGHRVQAFDLSEGMLEQGRQKAARQKLQVEFKAGDAEKVPLPHGAVDLTINRHVLWTLPRPVEALKEWKRVTKAGGRVIVIDGLWGLEAPLPQKLQKQAGKLLLEIQKRLKRGGLKSQEEEHAHRYTLQLMQQLPAMKLQNYEQLLAWFSEAGLISPGVSHLPKVDAAERRAMPFANRLASSTERHYVITARVGE